MSHLGFGVMINMLGGSHFEYGVDAERVKGMIGKEILSARLDGEETLRLEFAEGTLTVRDDGQSCCEYRHMSTDDDLASIAGEKLVDIGTQDGPDIDDGYDVHEQQFLIVRTDKSTVTLVNHNEHNGYYGGFWIRYGFEEK